MIAADSLLPTWGDRIFAIILVAALAWSVWYVFVGRGIVKQMPPQMSVECKHLEQHRRCHDEACMCPCHRRSL